MSPERRPGARTFPMSCSVASSRTWDSTSRAERRKPPNFSALFCRSKVTWGGGGAGLLHRCRGQPAGVRPPHWPLGAHRRLPVLGTGTRRGRKSTVCLPQRHLPADTDAAHRSRPQPALIRGSVQWPSQPVPEQRRAENATHASCPQTLGSVENRYQMQTQSFRLATAKYRS